MTSAQPEKKLLEFRCPHDNALVFKYSEDFVGHIEGKCRKCKKIYSVEVSEKKSK